MALLTNPSTEAGKAKVPTPTSDRLGGLQMFQILETMQQISPMECVSGHSSLLLQPGAVTDVGTCDAINALGALQRNLGSCTRHLPSWFCAQGCVTYFVVLQGKPLGFVDRFLLQSAAGSAAAQAGSAFRNSAELSLQSSTCTGTKTSITETAWWCKITD